MAPNDPWAAVGAETTDPRFGSQLPYEGGWDPANPALGNRTSTWTPPNDLWRFADPSVNRGSTVGMSALDQRIAGLNNIYGDYSSALRGAGVNYDPYRDYYNEYYGQTGQPTTFSPEMGGGYTSQPATGQYASIAEALANANRYYGDQSTRYDDFYGDQQTRYEGLAGDLQGLSMGTFNPETGQWEGGFYNRQYAGAMGGANTIYDFGMGAINPETQQREGGFYAGQYGDAMGNADMLRALSQGFTLPNGEFVPGFYQNQYAGAETNANLMRDLALGEMGPEGERTGGFYQTQYDTSMGSADALRDMALGVMGEDGVRTGGFYNQQYDTATALTESLFGEEGTAPTIANTLFDMAGGVLGEDGTRMGGFYREQATAATNAANAAYSAAAAEAVETTETRAVLDAAGEAVLDEDGEPVTEAVVSYQGGFYSVQEANQIRRARMAEAEAVQQAAAVRAKQVEMATNLYDDAKQYFSNEKDLAIAMLAAMEGVQVAPNASPEEIAQSAGVRGRYAQQVSFFGEQEQRGITELARQIGVINAEEVRRSGRVQTYEDLMRGRISEQETALLERIGGLQSAATAEMATVQASEEQRLADLRSGYGTEVSEAVAALQAQGIDPTQLQGMTAQTGALLGAQEASQLAMLERLQRAQTMLGSEQQLAATSMAGDARLALENQLFSTRAGIEEDIYGRLEGVEQQKFGIGEGAALGGFQAGQVQSAAIDELGREAFGYGSQARQGEFGARQAMEGALGAADIGESERVFGAGQQRAATVGAAGDMARAGIFQSGQQQAAAIAQANAMRDSGLFGAESQYQLAMAQVQQNLLQGGAQATAARNLGGFQSQAAYQQAYAQALGAQQVGGFQTDLGYQQTMADALNAQRQGMFQSDLGYQQDTADALSAMRQGGFQSNVLLAQQQQQATAARDLGLFGADANYYQSMFDAAEGAKAGTFNAAEAAATGTFNAQQTADAQVRATQTDQFNQMMQLAMQESTQAAGLQGDLAQVDLTRDLAINAATQKSEDDILKAEQATAAGVATMQAWFAPGSSTAYALYGMGYTPESIAGFDNTTLRAIVTDYNDQERYRNENVQTQLPWDQNTLFNRETGDYGYLSDYPGQAAMRTGQFTSSQAISPWEQAQAAGFAPWQDPMTYSNAEYMSGDYPSTYGYEQTEDWTARDQAYDPLTNTGTGVGFPLGTMDQYGPTLENLNALKQYGALQGYPYPTGTTDAAAVGQWMQDVIALSQGLPLPTRDG